MTPKRPAAKRKTTGTRSRPAAKRPFSYDKWAAGLRPDFSGVTHAGIHMTLLTWLDNGQWYWVVGWGTNEAESQDNARTQAIGTRARESTNA